MPSSLTTSRRKPSPSARETFAACWHPETAVELVNGAFLPPEESPLWCRQCGSLYRDQASGWEAPQSLPAVAGETMPHAPPLAPHIAALIATNQGIFLDVACGSNKTKGAIGMDIRALPKVDVVWDLEETPWPFPDACAYRMLLSHIVEHLKPWRIFPIFEEIHRILKSDGQVLIATPYPGHRFWMDPTHVHAWNETTCRYWDQTHASGLWHVYEPSPFHIDLGEWSEQGDLNVIMSKVARDVSTTGNG